MLSATQTIVAETLEQCQQLAAEHYPAVKRYDLIGQTQEITLSNLVRGWLPQISLSAQATLQSDVVTLPDALSNMMTAQGMTVKGIKKDQYKLAVDLQQRIWDGGMTNSQQKVARQESEVMRAQNDVEMYQVRDRVSNLYFGLLLTRENRKQAEASQRLLNKNIERLQSLLSEGVAMQSDVNALRAEALVIEQRIATLQSTEETLEQMLSLFCGKAVSVEMPDAMAGQNCTWTLQTSLEGRPEMQLFSQQEALLGAKLQTLDAKVMPQLSLFAQGFYGYPGLNMYEDMFSHDWSLNGIVGLRLQWNVSGFYTRKNDKQKLRLEQERIANSREVFAFNNTLQQTQEQRYAEQCRKQMAQDDEIIALRQSVREAAEAKLQDGIIDASTLLGEITREEQARIAKAQHMIEMEQHIAELRYINGE